ncbi:MAG TPA: hypothetical protein VG055_22885 [Planctomycetaceae bacterium]|nr:hypothetical protein [Planctomycetaceae bacterium]
MSPVFARLEPIDPTVRIVALAIIAAVLALVLVAFSWFAFRTVGNSWRSE